MKEILHLENLSRNMTTLAESIPCLKNDNDSGVEMERMNITPNYTDYMLFAKNGTTRRIIKDVFAVDSINFGYKLL